MPTVQDSNDKNGEHSVREGQADGEALTLCDEMLAETYDLLRAIASRRLNQFPRGATLNTTVIVHEAWLKLSKDEKRKFTDRTHYLATASKAMRQIIVDHARRKLADKRGGGAVHVEVGDVQIAEKPPEPAILEIEEALKALAGHSPQLEQIVECRFYAGMTAGETAEALGRSLRTVEREWTRARVYLADYLSGDEPD